MRWSTSTRTRPQQYDELAAAVVGALGDRVVEIHHVGSTSVPRLPAKPIIDIDLVVTDPTDEAAYVPDLRALGLVHWLTEPDWHQHRLLKRLGATSGEDHGALGAGMRYNAFKEPVVHEIYAAMFRAAGLVD